MPCNNEDDCLRGNFYVFFVFLVPFGAESVVWRPRKKKSICMEPIHRKALTVDAADLDVYEYLEGFLFGIDFF
jgi:hypothetical protein